MPRPTSSSSTPSLLPSALPKNPSQDSVATELPPSTIFAGKPGSAAPTSGSVDPTHVASTSAAPPPFTPFFTLITDAHSSTTHHPGVHYIFSDDDSEVITEAALRIHDAGNTSTSSSTRNPHSRSDSSAARHPQKSGGKDAGVVERYIVVELGESGADVKGASSLTGDWAVLSTSVGKAPTLEGGSAEGEGEKGLLLRIEGMEGLGEVGEGERGYKVGEGERGLEELVEVFERRMGELKGVVEGGGL
ncbi:hypothetical protein MMC30_008379 [Trapelia coarctata]|nr:hypothetical protein [Trapelia coarctata]